MLSPDIPDWSEATVNIQDWSKSTVDIQASDDSAMRAIENR